MFFDFLWDKDNFLWVLSIIIWVKRFSIDSFLEKQFERYFLLFLVEEFMSLKIGLEFKMNTDEFFIISLVCFSEIIKIGFDFNGTLM